MVHEFYKNPTVGFLEFYFTKYDFPRSPGNKDDLITTLVWRNFENGHKMDFFEKH